MHAFLGFTACDIPICGSSPPLFPPDGAVFAEPRDVVFALWFPDVSFFFAARAESVVAFYIVQEFRCLICLGESVMSFASQFGRVSLKVNIFHCLMNKHVQPSMNKHECAIRRSGFLL